MAANDLAVVTLKLEKELILVNNRERRNILRHIGKRGQHLRVYGVAVR